MPKLLQTIKEKQIDINTLDKDGSTCFLFPEFLEFKDESIIEIIQKHYSYLFKQITLEGLQKLESLGANLTISSKNRENLLFLILIMKKLFNFYTKKI